MRRVLELTSHELTGAHGCETPPCAAQSPVFPGGPALPLTPATSGHPLLPRVTPSFLNHALYFLRAVLASRKSWAENTVPCTTPPPPRLLVGTSALRGALVAADEGSCAATLSLPRPWLTSGPAVRVLCSVGRAVPRGMASRPRPTPPPSPTPTLGTSQVEPLNAIGVLRSSCFLFACPCCGASKLSLVGRRIYTFSKKKCRPQAKAPRG